MNRFLSEIRSMFVNGETFVSSWDWWRNHFPFASPFPPSAEIILSYESSSAFCSNTLNYLDYYFRNLFVKLFSNLILKLLLNLLSKPIVDSRWQNLKFAENSRFQWNHPDAENWPIQWPIIVGKGKRASFADVSTPAANARRKRRLATVGRSWWEQKGATEYRETLMMIVRPHVRAHDWRGGTNLSFLRGIFESSKCPSWTPSATL